MLPVAPDIAQLEEPGGDWWTEHSYIYIIKGMVHLTQYIASDDDFGPPE